MSRPMVPCDLCSHPCPKYRDRDGGGVRDAVLVDCEHCGEYYIAGPASTTLEHLGRRKGADTREWLRQWVRGMGGKGRITTDVVAKLGSKPFWEYVGKLETTEDPRGDFVLDTRDVMKTGGNPDDFLDGACREALGEYKALRMEYLATINAGWDPARLRRPFSGPRNR